MSTAATASLAQRVERLNAEFKPLSHGDRIKRLYEYFPVEEVLFTSSFGTKSVVMLHLVSLANQKQVIHLLNTGYHFPETLAYRDTLGAFFGLTIKEILPDAARNRLTRETKMWESQPDRCCHYNKVMPLREIKARHRVWMSGVHGYQTTNRSAMDIFEMVDGLLHFHPLVDISEEDFLRLRDQPGFPLHPLEALGYGSIGCTHCTRPGKGRSGRWQGQNKDECGLHL